MTFIVSILQSVATLLSTTKGKNQSFLICTDTEALSSPKSTQKKSFLIILLQTNRKTSADRIHMQNKNPKHILKLTERTEIA